MDLAEYQRLYGDRDDAAPGWDAIDRAVDPLYPGQTPKHWGTIIKHMLGGPDPIDGISAYECRDGGVDHLHFLTYGYSSLYYDEESVGGDFSRYGFEMTFRLASPLPPTEDPIWVCNLLQNLARYVFKSGKWFEPNHWIPANGPIRADSSTDIVGLAFASDPRLPAIDTPHGRVEFLQAFGLTSSEVAALKAKQQSAAEIIARQQAMNPLLITDLNRRDQTT